MKNVLTTFALASLVCGFALPAQAATSSSSANDSAYINSDVYAPTVGMAVNLHINFVGSTATAPDLQVQTTLGTLNGQGSSITLTPTDGTYSVPTLTSSVAGVASVSIYENGKMIGTTQVTFLPGPVAAINVQATPTTNVIGSTSLITINAVDCFGNAVSDGAYGSTFSLTTTQGQLSAVPGTGMMSMGTVLTIATHNGVAQAYLNDFTPGTSMVTVSDTTPLPTGATLNGNTGTQTINIPITYTLAQSVNATSVNDFHDVLGRSPVELSAERELGVIGIFQGDLNHNFHPTSDIKRSEFAQVVSQYMGLSNLATTLSGTQTKFSDVPQNAWYNGAVAAVASMGYVHGDGTKYYPEKSISYAEVAQVLLNNLGISTTGSWPNSAISAAQQNGLFNGIGSFSAIQAATRGDVAIMVSNALHKSPATTSYSPNVTGKTLETEMLGYTWYGNDTEPSQVVAVPGLGTSAGNQVQIQSGGQTTMLRLASPVQLAGANSLNDLVNKHVRYLTNPLGLVCYMEVAPQ